MKENWTYKKLGEVAETSSGGTPSKSHIEYYEGGTIPWLRSGEVAQGLITEAELSITDLGLMKSSAKIFPIDTVVIAMYGATVGQVGILKKEMATNQAICGIFPNRSFSPLFLLYSLKSKKSFFLKEAVGGAQPNISQNLIKNTLIPIPPMEEQERIVAELDLLQSVIDKKKAQLDEYDKLAQSIFYEMFGDPIDNPKKWEVKKLGGEFDVSSGGTPSTKNPEYWDGGDISWIGSNMCQNKVITNNDGKFITQKGLEHSNAKLYSKGTVLVALVGATIGKVALLQIETTTNQNIAGINVSANKQYVPFFVFYVIQSLYCLFENVGEGKFKMANLSFVRSLPIINPPLSLQQSFAEKIEAIELQKELVKQSLNEVKTLFDSRMDYYFN